MGDEQDAAAGRQISQALQQVLLGAIVHVGTGLVEQPDRGGPRLGPRRDDLLPLAGGQVVLAEHRPEGGVVAAAQPAQELVHARGGGDALDRLERSAERRPVAEGDLVPRGGLEPALSCADHRQLLAVRLDRPLRQISAFDEYPAAIGPYRPARSLISVVLPAAIRPARAPRSRPAEC